MDESSVASVEPMEQSDLPNMNWIPGGTFRMGSEKHYPEEAPVHRVTVSGFWIDRTPVTNRQFKQFVRATGHKTFAEIPPDPKNYPGALPHMLYAGSLVFTPPHRAVDLKNLGEWWVYLRGANWRRPYGPKSNINALDNHPVVHVAYCDALAYAKWAGKELPTEAEWECAARGGLDGAEFAWGDEFTSGGQHRVRLVQPRAHACHDRAATEIPSDGGRAGRQGLGRQRSWHEADGRQHWLCAQEAGGHGQLDNTLIVFTTDNGAEAISFPDGGVTPFKGQKGEAWEGGYRAPMVVRWPGHIKPGTVKNQLFAALDWLPTLVDIGGGPKDNALRTQIENGQYPGIVKTTLDGFDQRAYLEGTSDKSARDHFFYFSGSTPSAVRYKNWKMYYTMSQPGPSGWILPLVPFHFTLVQNIKRDPFEQSVGIDQKSGMSMGGALGSPSTAFIYDWNMLPIGQQLWLGHLLSYEKYPPLQAPETYNLSGIIEEVKKANAGHASD